MANRIMYVLLVLTVGCSFVLTGCGDDNDSSNSKAVVAWGNADLGYPLVGATMSFYTTDGRLLLRQENATGPYGDFYIETDFFFRDFDIEVTGGTFMNEPFEGRVLANVRDYDSFSSDLGSWININDVTTIVASYLERHPELSVDEAKASAARYLGVPDGLTLDWVIETSDYYPGIFSPEEFIKAIEEEFGSIRFDDYIAIVVDEVDQGDTHKFDDPDFCDPFADAFPTDADEITPAIAAAAVLKGLKIVFEVADAVFGVVELVFNIIGENQKSSATEHIISTLGGMQAQLTDITIKVNAIRDAQIKQFFTTQLDKLKDWTTPIEGDLKRLHYLANNLAMDKAQKEKDIRDIATRVKANYANYLTRINEKMGSGQTIGQSFTDDLIVKVKALGVGADTSAVDVAFSRFFLKYTLLQFQGYYLLSNAHKYFDKNDKYGEELFKDFRKDADKLKAQVEDFVKNAEKYVLNHQSETFYYREFPCTDPGLQFQGQTGSRSTILQYADYLAEILWPTYGFQDSQNGRYAPNEGALTVRIVFPVYKEDMKAESNWMLSGVQQNKNTIWLENAPGQVFTEEHNTGNTINLNQFPTYSVYSTSTTWASDFTGRDPYGKPVYWRVARAKMSTASLDGVYLADKGGEALKKTNPLIYTGGESKMRILTYSTTGNLKYGFYNLYHVPTMENNLKTFHGQGVPDRYIWVQELIPVDTPNNLGVYAGLTSQYQSGKTYDLQLKYTGNNCYTISSKANPYHFFVPKWDETVKEGRGWKIYSQLNPANTDLRWVMFKDQYSKDDTEAIYFKYYNGFEKYPDRQMMAYGDWGGSYPMYFGPARAWGIWHSNDLRKLFPDKHGSSWQFE